MVGNASLLVTGNVGGDLQLWSVDHTHSPPSVSMTKKMEVDGGIFSAAFDSKMKLVRQHREGLRNVLVGSECPCM